MITVERLTKYYGKIRGLDEVSFRVAPAQLTVVIGPSGGGKSTLLRCLNGLEDFDEGRVRIGSFEVDVRPGQGQSGLTRLREEVGLVFQSFNLFPHLTAQANVQLAPRVVKGMAAAESAALARDLLDKVGLGERLDAYPHQLSGGQQQRAAIARALAMAPRVMLYDEPTSALDSALVGELIRIMRQLADDGMTQMVVTHDLALARELADQVLVMIDGQVIETGTPAEIFAAPREARTREFLGRYLA
ncbi:MAG: amino acid ABC transporter ATP-binding protein [Acidobacteriota bacterium]